MKQTPELDAAQREMRPGVITRSGMLGADTRKLGDILNADHAAVQRLGVTHAAIAARMRDLRDTGAKGLGEEIRVAPDFAIRVDSVRGKLPCPFHHEGLYTKVNTMVCNLALDRAVVYTDLSIHMIEAHGFYEGRGSPFRLDPVDLVEILGVVEPEA